MKSIIPLLLLFLLSSCYKTLTMEGFDKEKWNSSISECDTYRLEIAPLLLEKQDIILEGTQNEVESLLGSASEHELYQRNQKFFHYRLTPNDECGDFKNIEFLSIRFNAIGLANEVQVMVREN
ncbi:MAG: hypothetical protein AB8B73_09540 [Ekhidna sp.]